MQVAHEFAWQAKASGGHAHAKPEHGTRQVNQPAGGSEPAASPAPPAEAASAIAMRFDRAG